ncbi:MAG: ABC transporter ATP-binding protein [Bacillota bacterium]
MTRKTEINVAPLKDSAEKIEYALEIENLSVVYNTLNGVVHAVNNVDLKIPTGKTLGLVGETGAGKTTTALAVMQLLQIPPARIVCGDIRLRGVSLNDMGEKQLRGIRGKDMSIIYQDPMTSLNPVLTVEEQIAEAISTHENMSATEAMQKAHSMLELVRIPSRRGKEYPHQFSGGMKQRVVIAMALATNPKLLIADEPTTALDVTIQAQVLDMIGELKQKYGTSMLMITHDLGIIAEICDEVSIIYAGHIVEHGTLEDIFNSYLHPYTAGLFGSLPSLTGARKKRLSPIPGLMPDPTHLPNGCTFSDRCPYMTERCLQEKPPRLYRNATHYIECFLYSKDESIGSKVK